MKQTEQPSGGSRFNDLLIVRGDHGAYTRRHSAGFVRHSRG